MRKTVGDKVKGAAIFFQQEGTEPQQETQLDIQPNTGIDTDTGTGTEVGTVTGTDTAIQSMLKPSEDYIRKVYYPLTKQDAFVKKKAKKYKVSESEIVRIMFDYFMKNGKI